MHARRRKSCDFYARNLRGQLAEMQISRYLFYSQRPMRHFRLRISGVLRSNKVVEAKLYFLECSLLTMHLFRRKLEAESVAKKIATESSITRKMMI